MGIDFSKLIGNLGKTAAKLQNDKSKIDTKTELNTYVSGWDAIKAQAEMNNEQVLDVSEKVDIDELEATMKSELASMMGADFGKSAGVENKGTADAPLFSDDEISLENMMSLLSTEDGLDIDKLREENKKPMLSQGATDAVEEMNDFGFDTELTDVILEQTPGAVKYITDAIKSGRATAIRDNISEFERDVNGARNILDAIRDIA